MLIRLLLCVLLLPSMVSAAVFTEGFEYADMTALVAGGWESAGSTTDLVSSTSQGAAPHGGSKMLRQTYDNYPYDANGQLLENNNSKITRYFTPITDFYERYWVRYECIPARSSCSFSLPTGLSNGGAKQHYFNVSELPSTFSMVGRLGSTRFSMSNQSNTTHLCPNGSQDVTCNLDPNIESIPMTFNTWHCVETHLGPGIHEQWINGRLIISSTRVISPNTWHSLQIYRQAGEYMYKYEDDLVVDTARIGCGSGPPPADTIPPSQVTGASATAASSSSILLTHSGATDAVGVTGYDYARCQGAACTNFTVVSTNTALSYTDTGLTASTLYRYRITAKDAAGNIGTASSIVEATTSAAGPTTRRQLFSDTITRADSADLGTGWDAGYTGSSAMKVVSNAIQGSTLGAVHMESDNSVTWPNDQWVQAQLVTHTSAALSGGGPACRMGTPATANAYWVDTNGSNNYVIRRRTAGTDVTIATSTTPAASSGVLRLECIGSAITLYVNDVAATAATDTNFTSGRAGVMLYVDGALGNTVFDNIVAGDYTVSTPPTITGLTVDATGATLTYGVTTPTSVRVQVSGTATISDTVVTTATTAGGRIQVGSDAFTRADAADLGTNWTPSNNTWALATNAAQASAVNTAMVELETTALQNNHYAQATLSAFGGSVDAYAGVKTRATDVGDTGYMCLAARGTSAGTSLERRNAGVATYLATESASVWAANDVIRLESDGVTHRCYKNGVKILEATDANLSTGFAGIWGYIAVGGTASDVRLDNFSSGNLTPLDTTGRYTRTWPQGSQTVTFIPLDSAGVENLATGAYQTASLSGVVNQDTTPPVISGGAPTSVLAAGTTSITESVMTNEPARCKRSLTDTTYALMADAMTTANGLAHTWSATGLANNTSYPVYVRCTDQYDEGRALPNNVNDTSYSFTYSVAAAGGDTTAPSTVTGVSAVAVSASQINVTFTAATDNTAVVGYEGHLCSDSVCTTSQLINPTWSTATSQSITGLGPSTRYYIAVKAFDAAGNRSAAFSNVVAVTTLQPHDVVPPSSMTGLRVDGTYKNSVVLAWPQGTDDQGTVTTIIEQSPAGCTSWSTVVSQLAQTKLVVSLQPSTTYCFRGKFSDSSGNLSQDWSDTLQVTTGSTGLPRPRLTTVIPRTPRS